MRLFFLRSSIVVILLLASVVPVLAECQECVYGFDNNAYCKPSGLYNVYPGFEYNPCWVRNVCYRLPNAGTVCYTVCGRTGDLCYMA